MTVQDFMSRFDIKKKETVEEWIQKGLIPGAKRDKKSNQWLVPDLARPPYTGARAKTTTAIYTSIVKACIKRKGVFAALYNLDEREFDVYISVLIEANLIRCVEEDRVRYYYSTLKSEEYASRNSKDLAKFVKSCVSTVTEAAAKGMTAALLAHQPPAAS